MYYAYVHSRPNGIPFYVGMGRKISEKTRLALIKANTGKRPSEESKEKNRLWHLGRKQSEETKEKRAAKHRGRKNTSETIERMRRAAYNRKPRLPSTTQGAYHDQSL